jgi:carbonic anhydrase
MSSIDELAANNAAYAESFGDGALGRAPAMPVVILTCIDARVDPAQVLGLEVGDAHVVRNAGGLVTDDALRSIAISQHTMGTTEVLILHHTGCGMTSFADDDLLAMIEERTGSKPSMPLGSFPDIEQNLRDSVTKVRACSYLSARDGVRGYVYDTGSGKIREVR